MNDMPIDSFRAQVREYILEWLSVYLPGYSELLFHGFVLLWIAITALVLHVVLHHIVLRIIAKFQLVDSDGTWLNALNANRFFHELVFMIQSVIVQIQSNAWFAETSLTHRAIILLSDLFILFYGLMAIFSFLDAFESMMSQRIRKLHIPLRGVLQTIKLVVSLLGGLIGIAILLGKSPVILLSGVGALSAVVMLVFKDPILGLVAGIQLSVNNMLKIGDWLEMPKYNADGDVIDICLTTVKVQNFDKTITTIPTYALISDSFKNWRGMSDSGGRRIKRSLLINTASVRFLTEDDINRLGKNNLLGSYLAETKQAIERYNQESKVDMSIAINGRRLTNIGTFRKYLVSYLKNHPQIQQEMTLLVRQLAPSAQGLPIEIYVFTNTTKWSEYENIQSDIFDHIFATLGEFDLVAHESPVGKDIRALVVEP